LGSSHFRVRAMAGAIAQVMPAPRSDGHTLLATEECSPIGSDEAHESRQASVAWRRWGVSSIALALVGACIAAGTLLTPISQPPATGAPASSVQPRQLSARMLLESPELHEVATDNVMKIGHGFLRPDDRERVRAAIAMGFLDMSASIKRHSPQAAIELDTIQLTGEQKDALLRTMRLISDPRVQMVGLNVAHAIRESQTERPEIIRRSVLHQDIMHRIGLRLEPHSEELKALHDELLPQSLQGVRLETDVLWTRTFEPHNLRVLATVDDEWDRKIAHEVPATEMGVTLVSLRRRLRGEAPAAVAPIRDLRRGIMMPPQSAERQVQEQPVRYYDHADDTHVPSTATSTTLAPDSEEAWRLAEAVMEQGRAHLRLIRAMSKTPSSTHLSDAVESSKAPFDCHLEDGQASGGKAAMTKALMCPLKLGSQGLDVLINC